MRITISTIRTAHIPQTITHKTDKEKTGKPRRKETARRPTVANNQQADIRYIYKQI